MVTDELGLAPPAIQNIQQKIQNALNPNSTAPGSAKGEAMRAQASGDAAAAASAAASPSARVETFTPLPTESTSTAKKVAIYGGLFAALTGIYLGFFRGKGGGLSGFGDGERYKTFIRSAKSMSSFAKAKRQVVDKGLTYDEAQRAANRFNAERTTRQINSGTKMEFTRQ